ncbi:hypothetical protein KJ603_01090 [Patescibacteria group bacterium]|nr:hypothetical protein [Patescibacteria group bacterium]
MFLKKIFQKVSDFGTGLSFLWLLVSFLGSVLGTMIFYDNCIYIKDGVNSEFLKNVIFTLGVSMGTGIGLSPSILSSFLFKSR